MKTAPLNSFLKFYVMTSTGIDLYGIVHVKVDFIPGLKMCVLPILGKFVWSTTFAQCVCCCIWDTSNNVCIAKMHLLTFLSLLRICHLARRWNWQCKKICNLVNYIGTVCAKFKNHKWKMAIWDIYSKYNNFNSIKQNSIII